MTDPFVFDTISPRYGLPLLFAGQSQKEAFVNEAFSIADALFHCAVEGELSDPPVNPADGQNWIVGNAATGDWLGQDGALACRQAGNWLFIAPQDGFRVMDRSNGQEKFYLSGWQVPSVPTNPSGGLTIDAEARIAIGELITALRISGILPTT